jgi:hypothetical protein
MLARPSLHPDPISPHAAVGGLTEAFEEVLDLGLQHGLGRLVHVHHHGPLEVRHGIGYGVDAVIVCRGPQPPTDPL